MAVVDFEAPVMVPPALARGERPGEQAAQAAQRWETAHVPLSPPGVPLLAGSWQLLAIDWQPVEPGAGVVRCWAAGRADFAGAH